MELLLWSVHEPQESSRKEHSHQCEDCYAYNSCGDSGMYRPVDVLVPSGAETVCYGNACADGQTYEKVYHKIDDRARRAHGSNGIASAAATYNYKVGGVEQKLENSRKYNGDSVEYYPADQGTLTHIRCFSWHKKDSVLPHIIALRRRIRAQKKPPKGLSYVFPFFLILAIS